VEGSEEIYRSVNAQSVDVYPQNAAFPIIEVISFFRICRRQDITGSDFHTQIMKYGKNGIDHGITKDRMHHPTLSAEVMGILAKPQNWAALITLVPDNRETHTASRITDENIPVQTIKIAGKRRIVAILALAFSFGSFSRFFFSALCVRGANLCCSLNRNRQRNPGP